VIRITFTRGSRAWVARPIPHWLPSHGPDNATVTPRGTFRLTQYRSARCPAAGESTSRQQGTSRGLPARRLDLDRNEITDIIPFNEFGAIGEVSDTDELDFSDNAAFNKGAQVLRAPELDDLHATDNLPVLRLTGPSEFQSDPGVERGSRPHPYELPEHEEDTTVTAAPWLRGGQHRKQLTGAARGRLLIGAMAAGAAAAAAHSATHTSETSKAETVLAADSSTPNSAPIGTSARGMQMVTVQPAANVAVHNAELAKGVAFAQERAQREARLQQPLFVMPTRGIFTSGFGYRWGVLHAGIDIANSIGTPIRAVSDGVVIDVGPTAGYGMWVKIRHADGTVTLYGHINTAVVSIGERVMAGDQIATMGNRGNSTGPHLHLEVLLGGTNRVDPVPWLAKRGVTVGTLAG
jgi:murein DD-endopeptidase MepM/ murein hydrolase activator NlpD